MILIAILKHSPYRLNRRCASLSPFVFETCFPADSSAARAIIPTVYAAASVWGVEMRLRMFRNLRSFFFLPFHGMSPRALAPSATCSETTSSVVLVLVSRPAGRS